MCFCDLPTKMKVIFFLSRPGCIKRYQHKRELEQETLFDRAAIGFAERLDKQSGCVPR